jgi:hypothetical protein
MAHKGINEWTGAELSSVALGQNGFHVLTNGAFTIGADETITNVDGATAHTGKNDGLYWIALKAVDVDSEVSARTYGEGDDLSKTGAYNGAQVTVATGDIVYGAFDAVTVDSNDYIIAYIGR